MLVAILMDP